MRLESAPSVLAMRARSRRLPPPEQARQVRKAANITVAEMAASLGVHPVTVQRWEQGARRPRGLTAARYAAVLAELAEVVE